MAVEPITREEMYLAKAGGAGNAIPKPITRREMFLAKAAGEDVETPTPITREEMFLSKISGGSGSGGSGGEGVKTCNVRIKSGMWTRGVFLGVLAYTKLVDGEIEPVHIADYEEVDEFDIMLENVVCGTVITIKWMSGSGTTTMNYDEDCITIVDPTWNFSDPCEFIVKPNATDTEIIL